MVCGPPVKNNRFKVKNFLFNLFLNLQSYYVQRTIYSSDHSHLNNNSLVACMSWCCAHCLNYYNWLSILERHFRVSMRILLSFQEGRGRTPWKIHDRPSVCPHFNAHLIKHLKRTEMSGIKGWQQVGAVSSRFYRYCVPRRVFIRFTSEKLLCLDVLRVLN